jgi:hypothetical protein
VKYENLKAKPDSTLVRYFREISLAQEEAEIDGAIARYNRLFAIRMALAEKLRLRPGDQRRQLTPLFDHPNLRVRLYAALETLVVAPAEARQVLRQIHAWRLTPYCAEAASILNALDDGSFVPT